MSTNKPSLKRLELRSKVQFTNPLLPFLDYPPSHDVPQIPRIMAQSIIKFVDSQPTVAHVEESRTPKPRGKRPGRKPTIAAKVTAVKKMRKKKMQRVMVPNSSDYDYDYTNDSSDDDDVVHEKSVLDFPSVSDPEEEVHLVYNKSNMPKYVGQFVNVFVDKRLKRKCKTCGAMYTDLKGFNRHYESKHL
ncbi:hypothetical protein Cantr_04617 [Candida viswanathii]|uniref:C2H2-type domain-containing protein n=1 Tax=Candida viswanathii TaxID=5486 RepID=A0A367XQP3_9ASCO|nr:hypothetical protein Cantr_04617 [Candida viswanathii]